MEVHKMRKFHRLMLIALGSGTGCILACSILAAQTSTEWDIAAKTKWIETMQLGQQQLRSGKYEAARTTLTGALDLARSKGAHPALEASTLNNLGDVADELGRFREAERCYKRLIALWESLGGEGRLPLVQPLNN